MSTSAPIKTRLLNGARLLGTLWNSQVRCPNGWKECACVDAEKTKFCRGKTQWLVLATEDRAPHVRYVDRESSIYLLECMSTAELDATGVTVKIEMQEVGVISVGSKGEISWKALYETGPETFKAAMMILRKFPGSKLVG